MSRILEYFAKIYACVLKLIRLAMKQPSVLFLIMFIRNLKLSKIILPECIS